MRRCGFAGHAPGISLPGSATGAGPAPKQAEPARNCEAYTAVVASQTPSPGLRPCEKLARSTHPVYRASMASPVQPTRMELEP
jgi:hypothetical protein